MRALVLDDDPAMVAALMEILADEGYLVSAASTVVGARRLLESVQCDVALIDLALGEDRGRHLLDDVANLSGMPPMVVVSGQADGHAVAAEFAIPFVAKPFELPQLLSAITVARAFYLRPQPPRRNASGRRRAVAAAIREVSERPPKKTSEGS